MSILDRARGTSRLRIDASQLADELAKHLPDLDVDLGRARASAEDAVHEAADRARHSLDRAGDRARTLRSDVAHASDRFAADNPRDDLGQRLRAAARTSGLGAVIARLERELPDTDTDRYERAYARGRVQARTKFLVVGVAAGVMTGIVAAILYDPRRGKARREAIARKLRSLAGGLSARAAGKTRLAGDRARGLAVERGLVDAAPADIAVPVAAPAWPAAEGPLDQPLHDPAFGAHEALPEELVSATAASDPGAMADASPRA
jgi:hypothetical protein